MGLKFKYLFFSLLIGFFTYLLISSPTNSANPKNTITVLPQLTQLDLSYDSAETKIYYTNNASYPVELAFTVEDVRELEDRSPVGILDPKEAANYKYSLSSWVYLDKQNLILNPGEMKPITVNINKEKLSPGGHYGTVLAEIRQTDADKKAVKVKGVLAALLFVRASTGNEREEAKIAFFGTTTQGITIPEDFFFRFQNTGNVDLTPYGILEVKDRRGNTIAKGIVNEDSLITLPEAIRKYSVHAKPLQALILPGQYKAVLSLHFGKSNKTITASTTFVTAGSDNFIRYIIIGIIVGAVLLFALKMWVSRQQKNG